MEYQHLLTVIHLYSDADRHSFRVIFNGIMTPEELISRGDYGFVDHRIKNLLPDRLVVTAEILTIVRFGAYLSAIEVIDWLKRESFRPATATELICLGNDYPVLPRIHTTVALGTVLLPNQHGFVYFEGSGGYVSLKVAYGDIFGPQWWFAAVKSPQL